MTKNVYFSDPFLAELAKGSTHPMQLGSFIVVIVVAIIIIQHHLCTVIAAASLMGATSHVAYIGIFPHKCTSSNLGCGI